MNDWLIVFAKDPSTAKVKTRLADVLSSKERRTLYRAFLKDTAAFCGKIYPGSRKDGGGPPVRVLAYESRVENPSSLRNIFRGYRWHRQAGADLGEKMHNAFRFARENGAGRMVIIGTDVPDLPPGYIEDAFREIKKGRLVLGPCPDGGYYLIGLDEPCRGLFRGIKWGSGGVLEETARRAGKLGKQVVFQPRWQDVDDPVSLASLKKRLSGKKGRAAAGNTAAELRKLGI